MSLLEVNHLAKTFSRDTVVLKDVSFSVNKGDCVTIIGSSGSGKSTLLRMIAGLEEITSGEFYIDDKLVNDLSAVTGFQLLRRFADSHDNVVVSALGVDGGNCVAIFGSLAQLFQIVR